MAGRAGLVAKKITVQGHHGPHQTTVWVRTDAEHHALLEHHRAAKTTAPPGSQFTDEARAIMRRHGVTKMPAAEVMPSEIHANLHEAGIHNRAVATWKDTTPERKRQAGYTQEFNDRNQAAHYEVVKRLRPKFQAANAELLTRAAAGSEAHAAGAVIAHTGLRVGGEERVINKPERLSKSGETIPAHPFHGETVHGISTLQARHVTVEPDGSVRLKFVGKGAHENNTHITDPAIASLISSRVAGKSDRDPVFNTDDARIRAAMPTGFRPKDMRTLIAWDTSERALANHRPPPPITGDDRTDMRNVLGAIRHASTVTSEALNNTAAVARNSYIHPDVWSSWAQRTGVNPLWIGLKGVNPTERDRIIPPPPPRDPNAPKPPKRAKGAPKASAAARMRKA